jgi:tRNA threonylcarbamoyladenosine biosynthesis protein TsaB
MILTLRTDKPDAEIGLFAETTKIDYVVWTAHRQLSESIHNQITALLQRHSLQWKDISAIASYIGPGSFTGLRIGLTVANTLAYSLQIPVVTASGNDWIRTSLVRLKKGDNDFIAIPEYGRNPHITTAKK